jgi:hypothetical protein
MRRTLPAIFEVRAGIRPASAGGCYRHLPPVQTCEVQSALVPQAAPEAQRGEQAGARHRPPVQTRDAQSPFAPHAAPWLQVGEQLGGLQVLLALHTRDAQSAFTPHLAPGAHRGEQAGA